MTAMTFDFGVRRIAAAFLKAMRARSESGSKLPHSKMNRIQNRLRE
jgi:hypothetical protein